MCGPGTDWQKCPCDDCTAEHKLIDEYGYFCDLACGKRSQWINREAGASAMLEGLFKMARESPTGTFVIDSKAQQFTSRVFIPE